MAKFTTYHSRETVKARKVTDKEGETVVTTNGVVRAAKGDYVVDTGDGIRVLEAEEFEARYKTQTRKRANRRPPAEPQEPPTQPVAQTANKPASERVKVAQRAAKSAQKGKR